MAEKPAWDEAEEKTNRELGPYPNANLAASVGLGVAGYVVPTFVLGVMGPGDHNVACLLIGAIIGGGHYGWGALQRAEHHRHFAKNLSQIEGFRALRNNNEQDR